MGVSMMGAHLPTATQNAGSDYDCAQVSAADVAMPLEHIVRGDPLYWPRCFFCWRVNVGCTIRKWTAITGTKSHNLATLGIGPALISWCPHGFTASQTDFLGRFWLPSPAQVVLCSLATRTERQTTGLPMYVYFLWARARADKNKRHVMPRPGPNSVGTWTQPGPSPSADASGPH